MPIKLVLILKRIKVYFIEPSQEFRKLIKIEAPNQVSDDLISS
jgi:hypothetical protein